ncbi:cytochrome P450 4d1-like [Teleopsis dalmanni]|nr:cytochrome P450 4d1-like [Teleopsis dalmanni]
MFFVLVFISVTIWLAILSIYLFKYKHLIDVTKNIPSPPALPIIGHGHYFIGKTPDQYIVQIMDFMETHGRTIKIWLGPELNMIMSDIKDVEMILSTTRFNDKAGEYKMLEPWLQEGLLVSRGRKWHKRRKVITPAFHFKILDQFIEVFDKESRILLKNLKKESEMQTKHGFDIYNWINLCTLDTICESAMGVSINAQTNADSEYVRAVKT